MIKTNACNISVKQMINSIIIEIGIVFKILNPT